MGARIAVKVLVGALGTALSVVFFGFALPFFCLAMKLLPGLGVGGVVYLLGGAVLGLLLALAALPTLVRAEGFASRAYLFFGGALVVLNGVVLLAWLLMPERFASV